MHPAVPAKAKAALDSQKMQPFRFEASQKPDLANAIQCILDTQPQTQFLILLVLLY